ncbi:MAG TPA: M4 family metallopeptidase [Nocardioidaceae bacterium]|nr:M4 family metallopeptidase [Nocardioidaceae bacterium]
MSSPHLRPLRLLAALTLAPLTLTTSLVGPGAAAADRPEHPSGSFALSGPAARTYTVPDDVRLVRTTDLTGDRTASRYQQVVDGASVFGGQVTVVENAAGETTAVIGAHFPGLRPQNAVAQTRTEARGVVEGRIGEWGEWSTRLRLDPRSARLFYEVGSIRAAHRPVRWVDAQTGQVRKAFDAVNEGEGVGVKGGTKQVDTTALAGGGYLLRSVDGRQQVYDAGNGTTNPPGQPMTDADDVWDESQRTFRSPDQRPGVDAHYYSSLVDDFYRDVFGRDSIDDQGMKLVSTVHFGRRVCNAFWNGVQMTYGDGDGRNCLPLSGALDVVAHELTHGVTEYTSNLTYENESGALNEAFSDMMGSTLEFYAAQHGADPTGTPDWRIGEDVVLDTLGFRSMADPQEYGHPDHYSERYTGTDDNGGVHTNSGIPNHAFYLAAEGGSNAGCTGSASGHQHAADCDVTVPAVGLDRAQHVFYDAFTNLPEYANFCDARNATVAFAGPDGPSIGDAWAAVGVHGGCEPGSPPPAPCVGDDAATVPFESPHPYGNNGDCTWTYHHGVPGFAFRFSLLDTEKDYDFVYVRDGSGSVLARYHGDAVKGKKGLTTPCIPTSTGSVQLVTDEAVTAQGFTVDAVEPCTPR